MFQDGIISDIVVNIVRLPCARDTSEDLAKYVDLSPFNSADAGTIPKHHSNGCFPTHFRRARR